MDIKRVALRSLERCNQCINPTRGGRQTLLWCRVCIVAVRVSIPQGVDVKPRLKERTRGIIMGINPTRGGRQTLESLKRMMLIKCINPTRGGRQTISKLHARFWQHCINPTRGGRQTGVCTVLCRQKQMYQSHKGWTSNICACRSPISIFMYQSHKGWTSNENSFRLLRYVFRINPTRGGRQTLSFL